MKSTNTQSEDDFDDWATFESPEPLHGRRPRRKMSDGSNGAPRLLSPILEKYRSAGVPQCRPEPSTLETRNEASTGSKPKQKRKSSILRRSKKSDKGKNSISESKLPNRFGIQRSKSSGSASSVYSDDHMSSPELVGGAPGPGRRSSVNFLSMLDSKKSLSAMDSIKFSSELEFPTEFVTEENKHEIDSLPTNADNEARLYWRQMVARWKHDEMIAAMTSSAFAKVETDDEHVDRVRGNLTDTNHHIFRRLQDDVGLNEGSRTRVRGNVDFASSKFANDELPSLSPFLTGLGKLLHAPYY